MSKDEYLEIGKEHAAFYLKSDTAYITFLNNSPSGLDVIVAVYGHMVGLQMMDRIEDLLQDQKMEIYQEAKEWSKDQTKETLIKFSKALWALRQLIYLIQQ